MHGQELARRSLRYDAAYCATVGLAAVSAAGRLSGILRLPRSTVAGAGLATVAWAGLIFRLADRPVWESPTRGVAFSNLAASSLLLIASIRHSRGTARLLLGAVRLDVAAFAVAQMVALTGSAAPD